MVFKFLVGVCCCIGTVYGQAAPDSVEIDSLTYTGTGCPSDSVEAAISAGGTSFTLIFDDYVASVEPGGSIEDTQKNCHINVGLRAPAGWSYSIGTFDFRGYMDLEENTYASQGVLYYFGEQEQTGRLFTRWDGPDTRYFTIRETFPLDKVVWSACGAPANLNINIDIQVAAEEEENSAHFTNDSEEGKGSHIFGLQWQAC